MLKRLTARDIRPDAKLAHWYLIFTDVKRRRWWDRVLKPGFNHCYAMRWDGFNWLIVNPRSDFLEVEVSQICDHNLRNAAIGEATAVVSVLCQVPRGRLRSRFFAGPVTCVEVVKSLLGIRAFFLFTPWQLYNYARSCRGTIQQAKNT